MRASHGSISAKSVQMLGPSCHAAGFFLDGVDCVPDILYQSPERLIGEGACPEDDTWAVGVLLYYSLTGSYPFVGTAEPDLRARILWSKPKPLASFGLGHDGLQRVIDHVLAPDPAGRIRTTTLLRTRLLECHPSAAKLSALKLGKPDLRALSDETDDSQGIKLTGVIDRDEMDRQIRAVIERRKAARAEANRAAAPMVPEPWSEADTTPRRPADLPPRRRASAPEPPTTVRPPSVVRSVTAQASECAFPSVSSAPMLLDDSTTNVSAARPPPSRDPLSGPRHVAALAQTAPTRVGLEPFASPRHAAATDPSVQVRYSNVPPEFDPDATLQRPSQPPSRPPGSGVQVRPQSSNEPMWPSGSGVQRRPPGSGAHSPLPDSDARSLGSGSGSVDVPITMDTYDSVETGRRALGLSWDDMSESSVPASARASTLGLSDAMAQRREVPSRAPQYSLLPGDDTDSIPDMRPRWPKFVGAGLLLVAGGGLAYGLLGSRMQSGPSVLADSAGGGDVAGVAAGAPSAPTAVAPTTSSAGDSVGASASASSSPAAWASASASASSDASTTASTAVASDGARDTSRCVAALFPKDTFRLRAPSFDFVCTERDVHLGATAMRVELVHSRRLPGASPAMRELDELGWYQLALFSAARASCCVEPVALRTRVGVHHCPLDARLEEAGRAAAAYDPQALQAALEKFVQAIQCLARQGATAAFGKLRPPSTAAAALLHKMLARREPKPSP